MDADGEDVVRGRLQRVPELGQRVHLGEADVPLGVELLQGAGFETGAFEFDLVEDPDDPGHDDRGDGPGAQGRAHRHADRQVRGARRGEFVPGHGPGGRVGDHEDAGARGTGIDIDIGEEQVGDPPDGLRGSVLGFLVQALGQRLAVRRRDVGAPYDRHGVRGAERDDGEVVLPDLRTGDVYPDDVMRREVPRDLGRRHRRRGARQEVHERHVRAGVGVVGATVLGAADGCPAPELTEEVREFRDDVRVVTRLVQVDGPHQQGREEQLDVGDGDGAGGEDVVRAEPGQALAQGGGRGQQAALHPCRFGEQAHRRPEGAVGQFFRALPVPSRRPHVVAAEGGLGGLCHGAVVRHDARQGRGHQLVSGVLRADAGRRPGELPLRGQPLVDTAVGHRDA
ncbi:hypothetical protein ACFQ7Z_12415 [Streptomyces virginiae]|uniref:hypothetical protein n=1 Tax=Streptomyces virginiae TaxID=1961 RepID=UPI0036BBED20